MAENNAKVTLDNKEKDKSEILLELKDVLKMDKLPRKIETYDISNISGEYMVAGMCVMQDGVIKKNLSRRFKIKTVYGQDDPKCMEEVITRRLRHSIEDSNGGFGKLPDVIFADGGITQIRATKKAIENVLKEVHEKMKEEINAKIGSAENQNNKDDIDSEDIHRNTKKEREIEDIKEKFYNIEKELDIKVFGMVKNDKHQTRALMDENRNELKISENLMNLITRFQDTVHETAITYHRKLRDKEITKSELDDVKGIGKVKKQALLKHFGSVEKIKNASLEELMEVKGITRELAERLKNNT